MPSPDPAAPTPTTTADARPAPAAAARAVIGGVLMGLANLVPGISGGTMLLAAGVYPQFIDGVAEVSTFRFRPRSIVMLACIAGGAAVAILGLAGPVSALVVAHRWIMYCLFIGLTLGGVPILHRMVRPLDATVIVASIAGIVAMALMALVDPGAGGGADEGSHPYAMYFLAGLAGASAMVLPGVSGGYLLLVLGQYVTILAAVATVKDALAARDLDLLMSAAHVVVPVGLGVLLGVVGVSNLVKLLLARWERATVGVLLGLLLGAVIGLWPFQQGVAPEPGSIFRGDTVALVEGELVMARTGRPIEAKDYRTALFRPTAPQALGAVALVAAGVAASLGVARLGSGRRAGRADGPA